MNLLYVRFQRVKKTQFHYLRFPVFVGQGCTLSLQRVQMRLELPFKSIPLLGIVIDGLFDIRFYISLRRINENDSLGLFQGLV
jgi:hypothetical protein